MKTISQAYQKLFFTSLNPLFGIAKKRPVVYEDLPGLPTEIDPNRFLKKEVPFSLEGPVKLLFSILFLNRKAGAGIPNIRWNTILACSLMFTRVGVSLLPPFLLHQVILYFESSGGNLVWSTGLLLASALVGAVFVEAMVISHYFMSCQKLSFNISNILSLAIFRKTQTLSKEELGGTGSGELLNYMGTDTHNAAEAPDIAIEFCHDMLLIVFVNLMLFSYLGVATIAPICLMLLLAPLNKATSRKLAGIDSRRRTIRDKRVNKVTQIINSMRLVKYFVWEKRVNQEIETIREKEVDVLREDVTASVTAFSLYGAIRVLTTLTGFGLFLLLGNSLTPSIIFPCLALFKMLEAPFGDATGYIAHLMGTKVALERILGFLKKKHKDPNSSPHLSKPNYQLEVKNLTVHPQSSSKPLLSDINFNVEQGEKVALVGAIGSGKTVLLEALLGEYSYQGEVNMDNQNGAEKANIAFVSQTPVLMSHSIEENIRFGRSGDIPETLLTNTCLDQDLSIWPEGLKTEVGENGVNLSGGQRQRVNIARAAFQPADIVLMDDPFSAVDPHVEENLVERLFTNQWKASTLILSTQRFHCLSKVDKVIFLVDGKIEAMGSLAELQHHPSFNQFYSEHENLKSKKTASQNQAVPEASKPFVTDDKKAIEQFAVAEDRQFGRVRTQVFLSYFKKLGNASNLLKNNLVLSFMILIAILSATVPIFQDLWLVTLSGDRSSLFLNWIASFGFQGELKINLFIYSAIGGFALFWLSSSHFIWRTRALMASKKLHDKAWTQVTNTNIRFFDTNPTGRIINRFSRDLDEVDRDLGENFKKFIFAIVGAISNIIFMLVAIPALILLYWFSVKGSI